jgi:predicted enzyme related to lactoylglutathione lyase
MLESQFGMTIVSRQWIVLIDWKTTAVQAERSVMGVRVEDKTSSGAVLYAKDVDRVVAFYSAVLGWRPADRSGDHVVLESPSFQLVVLQVPDDIASNIVVTVPPTRRVNAAIKLVFFVPSIANVRTSAEACGGILNPSEKEWSFQGARVCDGLDPEGNVLQFRERRPTGTS